MEATEFDENVFAPCDAKLHGDMFKSLAGIHFKILSIFPSLEAMRPNGKPGIQALCSLHIVIEKIRTILEHCAESSKLYLAVTGYSILKKIEKVRSSLLDSLKRVYDIAPQTIGSQLMEIVAELESIAFELDPLEKQAGDDMIALLQQRRTLDPCNENYEIESFHQVALKLGITSPKAATTERRALKQLIERARTEDDKRKETIVSYLLHLMIKYSKLFRTDLTDDNDSQGSAPCSPTVASSLEDGGSGIDGYSFARQFSMNNSFHCRSENKSRSTVVIPEELRCPISLQLMQDPVIIASGQTYERNCIEKWFSEGHDTCPKTHQQLSHLSLTPNYCVKGLITSWCEQNGISVPDCPPECLSLNYWRYAMSRVSSSNSRSVDIVDSANLNDIDVISLEGSGEILNPEMELPIQKRVNSAKTGESGLGIASCYQNFLAVLNFEEDIRIRSKTVEDIRFLLKDSDETRIIFGANGFVEALLKFLDSAIQENDPRAQEVGAMALFNLSVNNDRNKEVMLAGGVISLLEAMITNSTSHGSTTALYLSLSCLQQAKPVIASSQAVSFLIQILESGVQTRSRLDSLHTLFNLSTLTAYIPNLLSAGILGALQSVLVSSLGDHSWTEKAIAVLSNLATAQSGANEIMSSPGLISALATILDTGEPIEQEQAAACLYLLCNGSDICSQMVLQEGVIPALVSMSVNGTPRGRQKAQKLLMLFREQRQRNQPLWESPSCLRNTDSRSGPTSPPESKPLRKASSSKKMGKALNFLWKSKSYSVGHY